MRELRTPKDIKAFHFLLSNKTNKPLEYTLQMDCRINGSDKQMALRYLTFSKRGILLTDWVDSDSKGGKVYGSQTIGKWIYPREPSKKDLALETIEDGQKFRVTWDNGMFLDFDQEGKIARTSFSKDNALNSAGCSTKMQVSSGKIPINETYDKNGKRKVEFKTGEFEYFRPDLQLNDGQNTAKPGPDAPH